MNYTPSKKPIRDEELVNLYLSTQHNYYFERLYERYSSKVYQKCLGFTKDPVRAEDYTHDIFLRLIVRLSTFKQQSKFSTWLFSITCNYCTDQLRTNYRRPEVLGEPDTDWPEDRHEAEALELIDQRLQSALDRLTLEEQMILVMKYQEDLSVKDLSRIHKVSESAVKMRLKRAKDKLRKRYLESVLFWVALLAKLMWSAKWPF